MTTLERVEVFRGTNRDLRFQFGPLPGFRLDNVVAYEFGLSERFEPWPGRTRIERTFVLLDVGVSFANPFWARHTAADGSVTEGDPHGQDAWYVDLIHVEMHQHQYIFRDLYIDVIVPTDGRHYRMLDFDDYADAMENRMVSLEQAIDGLQRWQTFLDRHLHQDRWPSEDWTDFPPASIRQLAEVSTVFGGPVVWQD